MPRLARCPLALLLATTPWGCAEERDGGADAATGIDLDGETGDGDGDGDPDDERFDVGAEGGEDGGDGHCEGPGNEPAGSWIWIANTGDSPPTVSKIDTRTLVERGRYLTRADGLGDPSRTSVALSGHAVVANRSGGVTKFYAHDCPAGPTSAGGPGSALPWGSDACIAWSTNLSYQSQRPVAWAPGTFDEATCRWQDEHVWTSGTNGPGTLEVVRLDGATGNVQDLVPIPQLDGGYYGAYGGAVDGEGNFWFTQLGTDGRSLVRVDAGTLDVEIHDHGIEGYGMQVDAKGRPWVCGYSGELARYSPETATFDHAAAGAPIFGCMPDEQHLWVGGLTASIRAIDLETMQVVVEYPLTGIDSQDIHGTSIDFDGYVWGVGLGTMAARLDPATGEVQYVGGLAHPYTYSDMTGYALSHAGVPPQG
jgi:hypothetical protein